METILGSNIERARKLHGARLTQERLAEAVDLHTRVVPKIEAGEMNIKATTLIRIQMALGCSWESLMSKWPVPRGAKGLPLVTNTRYAQ